MDVGVYVRFYMCMYVCKHVHVFELRVIRLSLSYGCVMVLLRNSSKLVPMDGCAISVLKNPSLSPQTISVGTVILGNANTGFRRSTARYLQSKRKSVIR